MIDAEVRDLLPMLWFLRALKEHSRVEFLGWLLATPSNEAGHVHYFADACQDSLVAVPL